MLLKKILPVLIVCLLQGNFLGAMEPKATKSKTIQFDALHGHKGPITALTVGQSSDGGNRIISASSDNTIRVWDFKKKQCMYVLQGHNALINSVKATNSDLESFIISGSADGQIKIWDLNTGQLLASLTNSQSPIIKIEVMDTDYFVALSQDGEISLWSLISRSKIKSFQQDGTTCISLNGSTISSASQNVINIWNLIKQDANYSYTINTSHLIHSLINTDPIPSVAVLSSRGSSGFYEVWSFGGENIYNDSLLSNSFSDMVKIDYLDEQSLILAATEKSEFILYDYFNNTIKWSALIDKKSPSAWCVTTLDGYIIYGSKETNNLMISSKPIIK